MLVSPAGFTILFISMLELGTPCPPLRFHVFSYTYFFSSCYPRSPSPSPLFLRKYSPALLSRLYITVNRTHPRLEGLVIACILLTTRSTKLPNNDTTQFLITIFLLTYTSSGCLIVEERERERKKRKRKKIGKDSDI